MFLVHPASIKAQAPPSDANDFLNTPIAVGDEIGADVIVVREANLMVDELLVTVVGVSDFAFILVVTSL